MNARDFFAYVHRVNFETKPRSREYIGIDVNREEGFTTTNRSPLRSRKPSEEAFKMMGEALDLLLGVSHFHLKTGVILY